MKQKITRVLRLPRLYVLGTGSVCVIESAIKRLCPTVRTQKKVLTLIRRKLKFVAVRERGGGGGREVSMGGMIQIERLLLIPHK